MIGLPLVARTCRSLSAWLAPAFLPLSASGGGSGGLELRPDLDQVDALSSERDASCRRQAGREWTRLEKATFLTANEKRTQAGYDPITGGDELKFSDPDRLAAKFRPDQPRVPAGTPDGGQWTNADGSQDIGYIGDIADFTLVIPSDSGAGTDANADPTPTPPIGGADVPYGTTQDGTPVDAAQARRTNRTPPTSGQSVRLDNSVREARLAVQQVQQRDPSWQPTRQLTDPENTEGFIAAQEAVAAEARARLSELLRDAIPNTNPDWGVNRLTKELRNQGFLYGGSTRDPGQMFTNPGTTAQVRIKERPGSGPSRTESLQKFLNGYYYRYRSSNDQRWGDPITIPDKH